jgi:4-amino-4-deoxychorismate lyase
MSQPSVFWLDGTPVDARCASEGIQFAYGIFETLRFDQGRLEQPQTHLDRLNQGLVKLGLNQSLSLECLMESFGRHVTVSGQKSGALKILALRRGSDLESAEVDYQLYFRSNPYGATKNFEEAAPYALALSDFRKNSRSPMAGLKWQGYADHMIEKHRAFKRGFQDVLFLNEMEDVAETAVCNLFWIHHGRLYTPAVECGILPGIMRANVLKAAVFNGMEILEGAFRLEAMVESDLVFVTNSLMRIRRVSALEGVSFLKPSAESLELFECIQTAIEAQLGQ